MRKRSLLLWAALTAALVPLPAAAHSLGPNMNALWVGVLHPVLAVEQGLTLLVLGILSGRCDDELPDWHYTVMLCTIAGFFFASFALPIEGNGVTQGLPLLGSGLMLLAPHDRIRQWMPWLILALAAILGFEIGVELPTGASPILFICGFAVTSVIALVYSMEMWKRFYRPWFDIAVRIVGSWLIAVAVILVGYALRPLFL